MRLKRLVVATLAAAWIGTGWWQATKPLPGGTRLASAVCPVRAADTAFIADISAADAYGRAVASQAIFDEVLRVVRGARRFIVLDYADFGARGARAAPPRRLAAQLTDALLEQRRALPQLAVLFVVDPASEDYGASPAPELQLLRAAGVEVVPVDLDALRDSNLVYSGLWRLALSWWDGPDGPAGVESRRLNFKADHRKLVVADDGQGGLTAVLGSASPLDRESGWSNAAVRISGAALPALVASELAVARFSGWRGADAAFAAAPGAAACSGPAPADGDFAAGAAVHAQLLTEGEIREALLAHTDAAVAGDTIDIAAFRFAERGVVESLLAAARRGVSVRLILDPGEDASGAHGAGAGLPNQPLAAELVSRSNGAIHVRWYRTHGERFHSAVALVYDRQRAWLSVGSANFTRRSLNDYNLEANLAVELLRTAPLAQQSGDYFETLWSNKAALGIEYTADYAAFADPSQADYWLCRVLEGLGAAPF